MKIPFCLCPLCFGCLVPHTSIALWSGSNAHVPIRCSIVMENIRNWDVSSWAMSAESRRVSASGKGLFDLWTQVLHRQHSKWHTTISVQHVCGRTCKSHTERLRTSKPSIFLLRGKSTKCYTTMLPRIRLSRLNTELLFQRSFLLLSVGGVIEMIKEQQRGKAQLTSDFQITPHLSCCAQSSVLLCTRAMLHFWIHNLYKMTKSGTFRLSDRHTHAHNLKKKHAELVRVVLKVPLTVDTFSNLQWQERDRWKQSKFNKRILQVLMLIMFRYVKYVFVFYY